jgi:DNA-binding MarR family transcriptional regulator
MDSVPFVRLLSMAVSCALEDLHGELTAAGHPNLRPAHGYALNAILSGCTTASLIAPRLGMTKQGAAKLLQTLLEEGYVTQGEVDSTDARRKPFSLTPLGSEAIALSVSIQQRIQTDWADIVGSSNMATTCQALETAVRAISDGDLPAVRPAW